MYAFFRDFNDRKEDGLLLLQEASERGCPQADVSLGIWHFQQKEYDKALSYLSREECQRFNAALYYLGYIYQKGVVDTVNLPRARQLYLKSAQLGNVEAQVKLAWMLQKGEGGPRELENAFIWLYIAADQGHELARVLLHLPRVNKVTRQNKDELLHLLEIMNNKSTLQTEPIFQGCLTARKNQPPKAAKGDVWANYYLATVYYNGELEKRNPAKAATHYKKCVNAPDLPAPLRAIAATRLEKLSTELHS